jgi:hypothetical protein
MFGGLRSATHGFVCELVLRLRLIHSFVWVTAHNHIVYSSCFEYGLSFDFLLIEVLIITRIEIILIGYIQIDIWISTSLSFGQLDCFLCVLSLSLGIVKVILVGKSKLEVSTSEISDLFLIDGMIWCFFVSEHRFVLWSKANAIVTQIYIRSITSLGCLVLLHGNRLICGVALTNIVWTIIS